MSVSRMPSVAVRAPQFGVASQIPSGIRKVLFVLSAIAVVGFFLPQSSSSFADTAGPEPYRIGPQDKIKISVVEWRPSRAEVFEWPGLKGTFTVGGRGQLSLPLVGEINAGGLTTKQLSIAISESLKKRIGMVRAPDTSVEITQFRPFYIVGAVGKAGEYAYRPGLTVLQAYTLAGGSFQLNNPGELRQAIRTRGEFEVLKREEMALMARGARLEAELDDVDVVTFPPELNGRTQDATDVLVLQQERSIFVMRRSAIQTAIGALKQLKGVFESEVVSLTAQLKHKRRQVELTRKEAKSVVALAGRGLATIRRQYDVQRAGARVEAELLQLETNLLKARQEVKRAEISIIETRNTRMQEVSKDLRATHSKLDEISARVRTAQTLLRTGAPVQLVSMSRGQTEKSIVPSFKIVRKTLSGVVEVVASETMKVRPGDTIKVDYTVDKPLVTDTADRIISQGSSTLPRAAHADLGASSQHGAQPETRK